MFAHRGHHAGYGAPKENTMAAFEAAHRLGYRYFETDVVLSSDGVVMAAHGSRTGREVRRTGLPLRTTLQALTQDELRIAEQVPPLEELLISFPDVNFNIDPKTTEVVKPLGRLIRTMGVVDRVCVGSFSYARTKGVAAEIPGGQENLCTATGRLGFVALKTGLMRPVLQETAAACMQLPYRHTTARMVERAHDLGLAVHLWTPNTRGAIRQALGAGANGIMSDELELLQNVTGKIS